MNYGRGDIKKRLLSLQDDFALNVNILLWCCWCAAGDRAVQRMEILNAVEIANHWSHQVTGPLRTARRGTGLIPSRLKAPVTQALYENIKQVELSAEKIELVMLARLVADDAMATRLKGLEISPMAREGQAVGAPIDIARRNVMAYLAEIGAARIEGFSVSPVEAFVQEVFSVGNASV